MISLSISVFVASAFFINSCALLISSINLSASFFATSYWPWALSIADCNSWYSVMATMAALIALLIASTAEVTSASVEVAVIFFACSMAVARFWASALYIIWVCKLSPSETKRWTSLMIISLVISPIRPRRKLSTASQLPVASTASKPIVALPVRLVNFTL